MLIYWNLYFLFQPPVPIDPWEGIVNATTDGFACPQEQNYILPTDEDCLFLNVYTNNVIVSSYLIKSVFFLSIVDNSLCRWLLCVHYYNIWNIYTKDYIVHITVNYFSVKS